jgi:DNA-directed RNA polymerase specialized sigma24 family protein
VTQTLFHLLDDEWRHLAGSPPMARAWRRWVRAQPALTVAGDAAGLAVQNRSARGREADPVLLALAILAAEDELAGRVLLQLLLPGTASLASRVRWRYGVDAPAAAVAAVWERIRTYPVERRPHSVAANILLDARKRLLTAPDGADDRGRTVARDTLDTAASDEPVRPVDLEAKAVLDFAAAKGVISESERTLLAACTLEHRSAGDLAVEHGTHPDTIRRHVRLATGRLRHHALLLAAA